MACSSGGDIDILLRLSNAYCCDADCDSNSGLINTELAEEAAETAELPTALAPAALVLVLVL